MAKHRMVFCQRRANRVSARRCLNKHPECDTTRASQRELRIREADIRQELRLDTLQRRFIDGQSFHARKGKVPKPKWGRLSDKKRQRSALNASRKLLREVNRMLEHVGQQPTASTFEQRLEVYKTRLTNVVKYEHTK